MPRQVICSSDCATRCAYLSSLVSADAAKLAAEADLVVAVVGLGNTEAEGVDRYSLSLPGCPAARTHHNPVPSCGGLDQNTLLTAVRAAMIRPGQKLVLVLVSAGPIAITNLADYDAVLYAGLGGQAAVRHSTLSPQLFGIQLHCLFLLISERTTVPCRGTVSQT